MTCVCLSWPKILSAIISKILVLANPTSEHNPPRSNPLHPRVSVWVPQWNVSAHPNCCHKLTPHRRITRQIKSTYKTQTWKMQQRRQSPTKPNKEWTNNLGEKYQTKLKSIRFLNSESSSSYLNLWRRPNSLQRGEMKWSLKVESKVVWIWRRSISFSPSWLHEMRWVPGVRHASLCTSAM